MEIDYIIVGAGSAGCLLADRLTEDGTKTVALIEAGLVTRLPEQAIPAAWPTLVAGSASYAELTVEQAATGGSRTLLPRGKGLGGSSGINAMVFARGHRSSYDVWPEGWRFDDLLPYFRRTENATAHRTPLRGSAGRLTVAPAAPGNAVNAAGLEAAAEVGYRRADDVSSGAEEGFGWVDLNIVDGRRQSSADAFLSRAGERENLIVITDATATRLTFDGSRCVGVEYVVALGGGEPTRQNLRARREVVLAAGALGTPALLMRSGVGPADQLQELGIPVVLDQPQVGENLHDHPIANVVYSPVKPVPARQFNHGEAIGLVRSNPELDHPDLQVIFVDAPTHLPSVVGPEDGYTIGVSLMTPRSRGRVRLTGAAADAPLHIDPAYFSDERDMTAILSGIRIARRIGEAGALDEWREAEALPGTAVQSDEELRDYVGRTLASYCHPVGTCRMGTDAEAVVDTELRVRGLAGLRVIDGSVIPSIPSANTNATVYAIAERGAELISAER